MLDNHMAIGHDGDTSTKAHLWLTWGDLNWRNDLPQCFLPCMGSWDPRTSLLLTRLSKSVPFSCAGPTVKPNETRTLPSALRGSFLWWAWRWLLPTDCPGDHTVVMLTQQQSSQDEFGNTAHFFPHPICSQTHTSPITSVCLNHCIKGLVWVLSQEDHCSGTEHLPPQNCLFSDSIIHIILRGLAQVPGF